MATTTDGGFITPGNDDLAAIPAAMGINNEVAERRLSELERSAAASEEMLEAVPELFALSLIDNSLYNIIMFHDWDDKLIGALAVPKGKDCRAAVNEYVKTHFIHPDLRSQTAAQRASTERADNYRGEYPYTGPDPEDPLATGGENTVENGGDYPLTNHLEYCFYGKDIDEDYPFVSGWAVVSEDTMEDTFTALSANQTPEAAGLTMADFGNFAGGV